MYDTLMAMPLVFGLAWAAVEDVRHRRIPNWLTLTLAATGFVQALAAGAPVDLAGAALGLAAGFALGFVLFGLNALGGGDVKLLAAVGAWIGPWPVLQVFAAAAVIGMLLVIAQALRQGRLAVLVRNSTVTAMSLATAGDIGLDNAAAVGKSASSVHRPLPYAVPVLLAVAGLLASWTLDGIHS